MVVVQNKLQVEKSIGMTNVFEVVSPTFIILVPVSLVKLISNWSASAGILRLQQD